MVDRLGDDVLSYETGDSVYVLVADADRNVSTSASDTLTVRLRSDKETTEEALVLTETGVNTGIFSAYMLFDETGSVSADGKLQVDRGDKLVARYRDPSDDFGNVANETSTSFYGLTVINGGSLLGNTTWNTSGSPYLLTGDITVPNTVTLTIESGVEVRFTPLTDDLSSGEDVNRIELIIEGVLRVKGAQSDTVTFMSNGQVPASGDWYGIVSKGSTGKVLMDYASINHYTNGVRITNGTWADSYNNSDTVSVSHTKFYGGGSAVSSNSGVGSYRPVIFTYNKLYECGVYDGTYSSYKQYEHNDIVSSVNLQTFEISYVRSSSSNTLGSTVTVKVNSNTFDKGRIYLYYYRIYGNNTINIEVNNNYLGRESYGIELSTMRNYTSDRNSFRVDVKANTILGNKAALYNGTAIRVGVSGATSGLQMFIENNTVKSIGYGINLSSSHSSYSRIKSNTIDSTYYSGIYLDRVSGLIESNTITKCGAYDYFGIDITSDFNYPAIDTLQYNTITGNGYWYSPSNTSTSGGWGGIRLNGYTQAKINYNNIYDNGAYEVVNNVAASSVTEQDAKFNYWGTYNNSQIALGANPKNLFKIYDEYDNSSLGFVNYGGYLNAAYPNGVPSSQSVTGEVSLVDRLGDDVLSYETGDSVYVLVADADRNVSTSASDTLTVRLRSDKETTEEALVLTETGVNTGIFSAYMLFDETGSVSADGKLQVDRGDKLVARYRDPSDDFGNVANETSTSFYGLTVINGGSLLGNTTWNTSGSPYLLTGDITVPNTVTLTIESGVEVRFTPLTDDLSSGEDVNRIELIIEGVLRVKGAQSDTVTFMSNGQVPASGDWYGIVSKGSTGKVLMDYASINHYTNGVRITNGTWADSYNNSDTVSVSHTKFYGGGSAVSSNSGVGSYRPVIFTYNKLYECGVYDGTYSSYKQYEHNDIVSSVNLQTFEISYVRSSSSNTLGSTVTVKVNSNTFDKGRIYLYYYRIYGNNTINIEVNNNYLGRESYGIELSTMRNYTSDRNSFRVDVKANTILGNKAALYNGTAIRVGVSGATSGLQMFIENNTVKSIGYGINLSSSHSSYSRIKSNTIDSTYYSGIYLDRVSGLIESNTITKCGAYDYFGIDITSDFNYPAIDTLQYNTITGNGYWYSPSNTSTSGGWGGIRLNGYTQAKINYNNIYDNGAYEVVNNVAASSVTEQDAKFNYWGTYNNSQIALGANPKNLFKIYDEYDNSSLGFVNYGGYLNAAYPNGVPSSQSVTGEVSLVDRLGDDVLSYETGDSVYVLVADADRNVSTSASDTLTVRLRSDKETTEEALVLTETGVNTGIFSAYMLFDETGSVSADGKLQVDRGDKLVARYRDPSDDFGNVANETSTSFYGLTVINGGSLLGNTTWNTSGSPYLLTGDITVPNTVTLTIESGVEVRFTPLTDDLSSGEDVNRIELIIEGVLRVKGAQSDTVTFMSNGQVPASGDWYGIVSKGSTGKVLMDYASINHYTNGVRITNGTWADSYNNSDTVSVSHTKFYGGGSAVSSNSGVGSYRPVIFTYNKLYECGVYDGTYSSYKQYEHNDIVSSVNLQTFEISYVRSSSSNTLGSTVTVKVNSNTFDKGRIYLYYYRIYGNNTINIEVNNNYLGRESYGIELSTMRNYTSDRNSFRVDVKANTILGNKAALYNGTAIRVGVSGATSGLQMFIENNTVKSIGYGINLSSSHSSYSRIKSNTIDSTYYSGIYLDRVSGLIESNTITKCGAYDYFGIDITSDFNYPAIDTLQYNTITGNGYWYSPSNTSTSGGWGGIRLNGYTQAKINYNNIYDNGAYEVVNNVAASSVTEQDAKFNYWGTYNNSQIALGANPKNLFKDLR